MFYYFVIIRFYCFIVFSLLRKAHNNLCVVAGMSSNKKNEKAVFDAAGANKTEVIRTLFGAGTDLNGYKDIVS